MAAPESVPLARRGAIPRGIAYDGPAILSYGFRPFFLGAGLSALAAMGLWLGGLIVGWPAGGAAYGGAVWHGHEMLFGYTAAALSGFMLTAIPNWTGRLPVSGLPLALLATLWLAGRLVMFAPELVGPPVAAIIDASFLPVLAAIAAREIVAGRNWKNLKILAALCTLSAINIGLHLTVLAGADPAWLFRAAVAAYVLLSSLVGGRMVPSFTRNWLARQGSANLPRAFARIDVAAMVATGLAFALWTGLPERPETAGACFLAALLQLVRLHGWRGHLTLREPLVGILHIAYLFIPLGVAAVGSAALDWLSPLSAMHLLTVGAIGGMTLAIMTRATLGHTGRKLTASAWTIMAYGALVVSALTRPMAELAPDYHTPMLAISGVAWMLAFTLYIIEYGPMLLKVRALGTGIDNKAGATQNGRFVR